MTDFLEPILSSHVSGFEKGYSCQSVRLVENCKSNLDKGGLSGTLLTNLSKAFDCLSHKLIISNLCAYGFNENARTLIANYFTNRKQCVKIEDSHSQWLNLNRGASHGSLMETFIYNVLSHGLLYLISNLCEIYN